MVVVAHKTEAVELHLVHIEGSRDDTNDQLVEPGRGFQEHPTLKASVGDKDRVPFGRLISERTGHLDSPRAMIALEVSSAEPKCCT